MSPSCNGRDSGLRRLLLRNKWGWDSLPAKVAAVGDVTSVNYNGYLRLFYRESRNYIWHVYWIGRWLDEQLTAPGLGGGELAWTHLVRI